MLIQNAEVNGSVTHVRVERDVIAALDPNLSPRAKEYVVDAGGGALLPGLHDHHLHLLALAAATASAPCGPPEVEDEAALVASLHRQRLGNDGWIRGIGYHDSVAGVLDRKRLDQLGPGVPIRVQHRSGAMWVLNSPALSALDMDGNASVDGMETGADGRPTGRLFRLDGWLREQLGPTQPPALAPVGTLLASYGVTGVTDTTPETDGPELALFDHAIASGDLPQHLVTMGGPGLPRSRNPRIVRGALKIILDEAELPDFDWLRSQIQWAHAARRPVAVHCVTRASIVLALAAFSEAGSRLGDRIEHASITPPEVASELARLRITVVTQPNFVAERGDAYLRDVAPKDQQWLYRLRGLLDAGVAVGGGTDAPFGKPDPWAAMRAAIERRTRHGAMLGPNERLTPEMAVGLFTSSPEAPGGRPRTVQAGASADLCLLNRPWRYARANLRAETVRLTIGGGRIIHSAD